AAGMGLFDDARRIAAEQLETLEDIAAEARARREAILAGTNGNGHHVELAEEEPDADETTAAPRRRGAARRRSSGAMAVAPAPGTLEVVQRIPGRLRVRVPPGADAPPLPDTVAASPGVRAAPWSACTRCRL